MAQTPDHVDVNVRVNIEYPEHHLAAVRSAQNIFPHFDFVVRGESPTSCWVDTLGPADDDGLRKVKATRPGTKQEWEMWEARETARAELITFIAGKGTDLHLALQRAVGLELIVDFALQYAPQLAEEQPTRRKLALRRLLASCGNNALTLHKAAEEDV